MIRTLLMLYLLTIIPPVSSAQPISDPAILMREVMDKFNRVKDYEASAKIKIDVDFVKIPEKQGTIWFMQPDKIRVKAPGFSLLPKRGMNFSPGQLMHGEHTVLFSRNEIVKNINSTVVKVIPGDDKSDIILATLWIDPARKNILKMEATTKNEGTFLMEFVYAAQPDRFDRPLEVKFTFDIRKNEMPLGLTGDFERPSEEKMKKSSGRGMVTIQYLSYLINEGRAQKIFSKGGS